MDAFGIISYCSEAELLGVAPLVLKRLRSVRACYIQMYVFNTRFLCFQLNQVALQDKLAENKALAERYQKLHSQYLQTKDSFFKKYEDIVNEESHLKDHKEVIRKTDTHVPKFIYPCI